jgi:hypothetical protein
MTTLCAPSPRSSTNSVTLDPVELHTLPVAFTTGLPDRLVAMYATSWLRA